VLEEDGELARIRLQAQDAAIQPYLHELLLFNTHRFGSWLVQEHLPVHLVQLGYAPQAPELDYHLMFLGNPFEFAQADSQLVLSRALLEKRVTQNEASLRHFLRHPALIMLTQEYAITSWTSQVRDRVRRQLRDMPELNAVATALDVHPQTLRRRLAAEGTTFKDIKNQVRRDTALHFLGKQGLSIEEISHRAGFSESSAFIRAFKAWTGVTPYTYRKGL
jgi:AraC-like DNA-binding protein